MSREETHLYEFGPFHLDAAEHLLLRDGKPVALTPKAFETLVVLVRRRGHLVQKDELIKKLWPDSFVEEANLSVNISTLRKALGEAPSEHQYIETVPKLGYRFVASVKELRDGTAEMVAAEDAKPNNIIEEKVLSKPSAVKNVPKLAVRSGEVTHAALSAKYIGSGIKVHKQAALLALATFVITVAAVVYFLSLAKRGEAIDSVAVLPFVNVSGDPNAEYLSDGISESIINSLSPNLKVIALNSVLRYKGKQTDPQTVGRELNVRAVLMGRLTQRGDDLAVSVELVDVRDNHHLWGQQYNRKLAEITSLEVEIAQEISEKLRLRLTGEEKRRLTKRYTDSGEAYRLYVIGRYYQRRWTTDGFEKSIELFEQAIKQDPGYAPAYAGLALTYRGLAATGVLPPQEARQKQEWAALKALQIDNDLAEAHAAMGFVRQLDLNWSGSEEEVKRALELNPNSVTVLQSYTYYLQPLGRLDEAMLHLKREEELDPVSLLVRADIGRALYFSRQYDRAIEQFQKTIEMDPNFAPAHARLALVYLTTGMYTKAIDEQKKAIALDDTSRRVAWLGYAYAMAGQRNEAKRILDDLKDEQSRGRYVSPFNFALMYMGFGDKDQTFIWLKKTFEARSDILWDVKVNPQYDNLRSDPRFTDLLRSMKLPL